MTIHYNLGITNGNLDGAGRMDLSQPNNNVIFAPGAISDDRSLLFTLQGPFGIIQPRQDIQQAERELQRNSNLPPLDIIQSATASRRIRGGVPAIDDFIMTHFACWMPDTTPPTLEVFNQVTTIVYEDLSALLVPTSAQTWVLRFARLIPTGHVLKITHPALPPSNFRISASFEPLDNPEALATLFTGGGVVDLNPVVAEAHILNPVPGPQTPRTTSPVQVLAGQASYTVDISVARFDAAGSIAVRTIAGWPYVGSLSLNGWTYIPQSGGDLDVVRLDLDTSLMGGGEAYELLLTNSEGGQAAITVSTLVS